MSSSEKSDRELPLEAAPPVAPVVIPPRGTGRFRDLFSRPIYEFQHFTFFWFGLTSGAALATFFGGKRSFRDLLSRDALLQRPSALQLSVVGSGTICTAFAFWFNGWYSRQSSDDKSGIPALLPKLAGARDGIPRRLRILTFNTEGGGSFRGVGLAETKAVVELSRADIVGLQETRLEADEPDEDDPNASVPVGPSVAPALARALDFYCYEQPLPHNHGACWSNAIISRLPISLPCLDGLGVLAELPGQLSVYILNLHLTDYPYQPYQLMKIPYGDAPFLDTEAEAVESARLARGRALTMLDDALAALPSRADVVVIVGDFNEPSHMDWTERAAATGLHPMKVRWPFSEALEQRGFVDAYRQVKPDEVRFPGATFDVYNPNVKSSNERIDFVYVRPEQGIACKVVSAELVGRNPSKADISLPKGVGYPSDHRALVVELELKSMSFIQHSTHALQQKLERSLFMARRRALSLRSRFDSRDSDTGR